MRGGFAAAFMVVAASSALAATAPTRRASGHAAKPPATIVIDKMAFGRSPPGLRVGDVVQWANHDMFVHSVTANDHSFDLELRPGAVGRVTLTRAGDIGYTCKYHPAMKGQLVVRK